MEKLKVIQEPPPKQSPEACFSVLFLVNGFTAQASVPLATVVWDQVISTSPFDWEKTAHPSKRRFAAYCDPEPLAINFQFDGKRLVVPQAQQSAVLDRIRTRKVPSNIAKPPEFNVGSVWEAHGRFGQHGKLVVVLVETDREAELYQLSPAPEFPLPFVAVGAFGTQYHKVVARALGQMFAHLTDEFELPLR